MSITVPTGKVSLYRRHIHTLHGFNPLMDGAGLMLGFYSWSRANAKEPDSKTLVAAIRTALQLKPDQYAEFPFLESYIKDLVQCPIELRDKAGLVIDAVRRQGFNVCLQTRLQPTFLAETVEKEPFSKEASERDAAPIFGLLLDQKQYRMIEGNPSLADERMWCTAEGKALAKRIAAIPELKHMGSQAVSPAAMTSTHPSDLDYGLVCDYDFPVASASAAAAPPATASIAAPAAAAALAPAATSATAAQPPGGMAL